MAGKRPRIQNKPVDERIIEKRMQLHNCSKKQAWAIHNRRMSFLLQT